MTVDLDRIRAARATLTLLDPGRRPAVHQLIVSFGPVEALAWLTAPGTSRHDLAEYLGDLTIDQLEARAAALLDATRPAGARVLIPEDTAWPARLDDLARVAFPAAPSSALCLWVRGTTDPIGARAVAVTGSRAATAYGLTVAGELGSGLAAAGWTVATTSGYGIAAAALRGALAAGGRTVAVLPGGIDQLYPGGNAALLTEVAETGLLVSAYPPGGRPGRDRVTAAGRLLAGMTTGTVVVEAPRRSHALTVLDEAVRRGRRALVVPGPVTSAMSVGAHQALRDYPQARLVRDTTDVLADLPPRP